MRVSLTAKYVAQLKFDAGAPVYREQDLEKRGGIKQSEQHDESSAMDISMETASDNTSGVSTPVTNTSGMGIPGLNMSGMNMSGMNTPDINATRKNTSHVDANRKDNSRGGTFRKDNSGMSSIRAEEDNLPTRPGVGAWTGGSGSNRSPIQLEDERDTKNKGGNAAKKMRTKEETPNQTLPSTLPPRPNHAPTGPKQWNYFEHYDGRKPSNLRH